MPFDGRKRSTVENVVGILMLSQAQSFPLEEDHNGPFKSWPCSSHCCLSCHSFPVVNSCAGWQ